ncbi:MAG: CoA pyrophosphatase [Lachnospiraceae bacterium]|nr:CoA pyrophosphatase [Lachnospiraceae bacterium]
MRSNEPFFNNSIELGDFLGRKGLGEEEQYPPGSSAVLIPILEEADTLQILLEVRSFRLRSQPGEICFPGGRIERGETPLEAALRETREELLVGEDQIRILGQLPRTTGPSLAPLYVFAGLLTNYRESFSEEEVAYIMKVPLRYFLEHEPEHHRVRFKSVPDEDFPYDLIPGGRDYRWREKSYDIPFYRGIRAGQENSSEGPVLWGMTARVLDQFAKLLKSTERT